VSAALCPLAERHLDEATALERQCFSLPWSRAAFLAELRNPAAFYVAAEAEGGLAGYAGMQTVLDEGYITNIAVAPEWRRRGVAARLLTALRAEAVGRRLAFLTLEVRRSNAAAISLYEKQGFVQVGVRPGYYEKPREDALLMTLWLEGVST
jgi:ribosomal-protein-alanine N-acetyltransferase